MKLMNRVLCLGRTSRTLLAFAAALVLCVPPGVVGELIRIAQPHSAPVQATVHKSCCSAKGHHEACAPEQIVVKEAAGASCCHRSDTT